MSQDEILKIVKKWKIKKKPEYRGFRCAKVAEEIEIKKEHLIVF